EDGGIFQRRDILSHLLAARERTQEAPHDLSRTSFRQIVGEANLLGFGDRSEFLAHPLAQFANEGERVAGRALAAADDVGEYRFALDLVWLADDRRLGDARVRDQRRF